MFEKWNLLASLIHTADCDGVIPVDIFMSGDRLDNDNTGLGWNEFNLWQQNEAPDNGENLAIENVCSTCDITFDPEELNGFSSDSASPLNTPIS